MDFYTFIALSLNLAYTATAINKNSTRHRQRRPKKGKFSVKYYKIIMLLSRCSTRVSAAFVSKCTGMEMRGKTKGSKKEKGTFLLIFFP